MSLVCQVVHTRLPPRRGVYTIVDAMDCPCSTFDVHVTESMTAIVPLPDDDMEADARCRLLAAPRMYYGCRAAQAALCRQFKLRETTGTRWFKCSRMETSAREIKSASEVTELERLIRDPAALVQRRRLRDTRHPAYIPPELWMDRATFGAFAREDIPLKTYVALYGSMLLCGVAGCNECATRKLPINLSDNSWHFGDAKNRTVLADQRLHPDAVASFVNDPTGVPGCRGSNVSPVRLLRQDASGELRMYVGYVAKAGIRAGAEVLVDYGREFLRGLAETLRRTMNRLVVERADAIGYGCNYHFDAGSMDLWDYQRHLPIKWDEAARDRLEDKGWLFQRDYPADGIVVRFSNLEKLCISRKTWEFLRGLFDGLGPWNEDIPCWHFLYILDALDTGRPLSSYRDLAMVVEVLLEPLQPNFKFADLLAKRMTLDTSGPAMLLSDAIPNPVSPNVLEQWRESLTKLLAVSASIPDAHLLRTSIFRFARKVGLPLHGVLKSELLDALQHPCIHECVLQELRLTLLCSTIARGWRSRSRPRARKRRRVI